MKKHYDTKREVSKIIVPQEPIFPCRSRDQTLEQRQKDYLERSEKLEPLGDQKFVSTDGQTDQSDSSDSEPARRKYRTLGRTTNKPLPYDARSTRASAWRTLGGPTNALCARTRTVSRKQKLIGK